MEKHILNPAGLAKPSGYNHGIVTSCGRLLFIAGQPGLDAEGRIVAPGDMVGQFTRAVANLKTIVQAAGGDLSNIVKLTIYVTDRSAYKSNLKPLGTAFRSAFGGYYPTTTFVEVKDLFDEGALVELDALAVLD